MKQLFIVAALLLVPVLASAQTTPPSTNRLVIERVENRFVVAPDFKVTEIDGDTGELAGGYAGWLAEDTLFVGGAAYWLADGPRDAELVYGGLLIGWSTPAEHRIQFGARGLLGAGRAELGNDITRLAIGGRGGNVVQGGSFARFGSRGGGVNAVPTTIFVRAQDDFLVFEPQLTLNTKLTKRLGITWAAGYRLTGYTDFLDDRLNGVTGSVALQWGGW